MTRLVDLSHPWGVESLSFLGLDPVVMKTTHRIGVSGSQTFMQRYETSMHNGTHFDAQNHVIEGGADLASVPLDRLYGEGVIVDISGDVGEWDVIRPEHITGRMEVRKGDILIYHTGWHDYFSCGRSPDTEKYIFRQPGGGVELAEWIVEMELRWIGVDCIAPDHPMNNMPVRDHRPALVAEYERKAGRPVDEAFPPENRFCMHRIPFAHNILHVENIGGDIDEALNTRCRIGAFPWRIVGGDACICRVVAFLEG